MNRILHLNLKKLILMLLFTASLAVKSYSQITDLATCYFFANTTTPYTPLLGGTVVTAIMVDDAASGALPIGFTFTYLGVPYTSVFACSNGYLTFGSANASLTNNLTTGAGRPIAAPLWDDLHGASGSASYLTTGAPGSRIFTFEWFNWRWYYTVASPTMSFQCKLYEATGAIEFVYRQEASGLNASEGASCGITAVATGAPNFLSLPNFGSAPVPSSATETTTLNTKPANDQHYIFTPLNNPDPNGTPPGPPVTIPPIASFAYSDFDTVWISSPRTIVNTSNQAVSSYWDVIGYNPTNKYGFYSPISMPRVLKNTNGFNDYFLDTIENSVNLNRIVFDNPGYYRVKLVGLNQFGVDTYIDTLYVDTPSSPPTAEFFAERRTIGVYDYSNMFDLTGNGPVSWYWYLDPPFYSPGAPFFNSFSPTAGSQNPALNANEGGLFDVCLVATNYRGSDTVCKSDYMKIISGYEVCKGTSTAKDTIAKENEGSAKLATVAGLYIPSLIGSCSKGFTIATCSDTVTLFIDRFKMRPIDSLRIHNGDISGPIVARYGGSVIPAAFSTVKVPGGVAYLETFLGSSTGSGDSGYVVRWNAPPPSYPKPTAAFSIPDTIYDSYPVTYTNQSTGKSVKYAWDTNGDNVYGIDNPSSGVDSTSTSPTRSFTVFLPYTANICLKASNCVGSDTACKSVRFLPISAAPSAEFTVNRFTGFTTDIFRFTDLSQNGPNQWLWTFVPDNVAFLEGTTAASQNPVVLLNSAINYNITLVATNSMGSTSKTKIAYVTAIAFGSPGCSGCPTASGVPFVPGSLDIGITRVTLADMDTTTPLNTPIYHALYNKKIATLYRGVTYTLSTSRGTAGDPMSTRAWIDFNRNTVFGDMDHEVIISEDDENKVVTTGTFTVPGNTVTGNTRMRIGVTYGATDIDYQVATLGCFEEYGIIIGIDNINPTLALIGSSLEKVELNKLYTEKGVIATDNLEGDISDRYEVFGKVDIGKVGYYILKYIVRDLYGNRSDTVTRTVQVEINQTGPTLVLNGSDSMTIEVFNTFTDPEATATSNTGTNLTSLISKTGMVNMNVLGTYHITYSITDQFGFSATKTRTVIVNDVTAPVIVTNAGTSTITHQVGTPYLDPITITDNYWTNVAHTRSGVINPNNPGTYNLIYNATDGSGNAAVSYPVTVIVKDLIPPVVVLNGNNPMIVDVYTTFNDPGVTITDNYYPNTTTIRTGLPKMNELGTDTLVYTVTDGAGNITTIKRLIVKVDRTAPEVELLGLNPLVLHRFTTYVDPGVKLKDNFYTDAQMRNPAYFDQDETQLDMTRPGYYFVTYNLTDPSGNKAEPQQRLIQVVNFTGVDEINANSNIAVYPNPSQGRFTVSTKTGTHITSIKVMDVLGKVVYTRVLDADQATIDLTQMGKGLYMIIMEDADAKNYSGKIVIE
jgi:PKD repeat protein